MVLCLLVLVAWKVLAAPATSSHPETLFSSSQSVTISTQFTRDDSISSAAPVKLPPSVPSSFRSNLPEIPASTFNQSLDTSSAPPVTSPPSTVLFPFTSTSILSTSLQSPTIVTEIVTAFDTTTVDPAPPATSVVTVIVTATATVTATPTSIPSTSWGNRTLWIAPPHMTDLSAFNITHFPTGQRNLRLVDQIPAQAISPTAKYLQNPLQPADRSTVLQLVYPAKSVNPASKPAGGADFYASPLNLTGARNVTLEYSVFFPADFNWVKGGKLPGLFGGHMGCSGGASARDCFSTRLMWRPHGVGELYLYAPKDKQTDELCADVASVCDTAYGFSIGRGAFNFTAGDWTHVRQNVVLNTPGENDGTFTLFVDERPMINRTDIFYRNVAQRIGKKKSAPKRGEPAEFLGLFFSTFFGGHGKSYATPKKQYTWFKDFAITRYD